MSVKGVDVFPSAEVLSTDVDTARDALTKKLAPDVVTMLENYLKARDAMLMEKIGEELKRGRYARRLDDRGEVEELVYFRSGP